MVPHLSEQNGLLPPDNGKANINHVATGTGRSIVSMLDEPAGHHTSMVELFSDLAVAVSVSFLGYGIIDNHSADAKVWLSFWLRIFFLHSIWTSGIIMTNIGNVLTRTGLKVAHHGGIFGFLVLLAVFIKACQRDDTITVVTMYLLARGLAAGAVVLHGLFPCPDWMDPARHARIKQAAYLMPVAIILDCGPLAIALIYFAGKDLAVLWTGLATVALGIALRIGLADKLEMFCDRGDGVDNCTTDSAHIKERLEYMVLVLIGQIFLAATTSAEDYLGSISSVAAIATAIGCFILYFTAHVSRESDTLSLAPRAYVHSQQLHLLLFCAIPTMAVAFAQIILVDEDSLYWLETNAFVYHHPQTLLSIAVAVFLVTIADLEDLSADPLEATPRVSKQWRVKFIMLMGVLVGSLSHFYDNAMLMAAISTLFAAFVQLAFVQLL